MQAPFQYATMGAQQLSGRGIYLQRGVLGGGILGDERRRRYPIWDSEGVLSGLKVTSLGVGTLRLHIRDKDPRSHRMTGSSESRPMSYS